ncbi:segregation/condensation protein A [Lactococcus hircilactis]|uniref:Segregation and condensation protein A n=1 Tax=Lactococcus hircilactis TaxID=1494462 RepID=A0A7X2CZT5_9LACT|nr:segregation/condensation protein A [Lactococcus hircilactis]MQW38498.1 segregation/condensation protein A [Lactococcus hircilactis]
MANEINIKINEFEGPLDLLLHLVSQYQLDIFEVPLVPVIEQYLAFLNASQNLELERAGEYMLMASQLILIKSRRLLPAVTESFEEDTAQLEFDLLSKIDEYRKFKLLSEQFNARHETRSHFYSKSKTEIVSEEMTLIKDRTSIDLYLAFNKILELRKIKVQDENTTVEAEKYTVSEKMAWLTTCFSKRKQYKFSQLFDEEKPKIELLTTFLALLELIKNQHIIFSQEHLFGEIILERGAMVNE